MFTFRSNRIFFRLSGVLLAGLAAAQGSFQPPDSSDPKSTRARGLLARIKVKMADSLSRLPNYICVQTIERSHRGARKKPFDRQDLVRLGSRWSKGGNGSHGPAPSALRRPI
ncbi:MAG TPA: hypothetical protein VNH18_12045 [Bryobacteraceae bacterium]|nr:hypothetical protein [Bryobacteraceae bacterium]HXJ39999.1 hypothetical protein [Bryobacteraceae bacterium]